MFTLIGTIIWLIPVLFAVAVYFAIYQPEKHSSLKQLRSYIEDIDKKIWVNNMNYTSIGLVVVWFIIFSILANILMGLWAPSTPWDVDDAMEQAEEAAEETAEEYWDID